MLECDAQYWWTGRVSGLWPVSLDWPARRFGRCWSTRRRRAISARSPLGVIDAILEDDKQRPRKQRHTAKRIFERLRAEHSYGGGYTIVKDYVRSSKIGDQEMFVPLTHAPGEAQADFGEALVVITGIERKAHFMAFDLPHSDDCFVQAFPAETPKLSSKAMFEPSSILAAFRRGFSTTTPRWLWRGS